MKISNPALYSVSDKGLLVDWVAASAFCSRADFRDLRVAMVIWQMDPMVTTIVDDVAGC